MQSNYIVKTKDNLLISFYYTDRHELNYKIYKNNKWSDKKLIIDGVTDTYSVTMSSAGALYLFCQDMEGNIILCQSDDTIKWIKKVILKNHSSKIHRVFFNGLIDENGLNLIYNVPVQEEESHILMSQTVNTEGEWSEAKTIDKIVPLHNKLFDLQHVTKSHCLLFYQKRTPENRLGYREFTVTALSDFNIFHTTGYPILETSFLTTSKTIHVLYVVKGMFSIQILYRKKESDSFSAPTIIWEAQKISNCMLTIIENKIYATWVSGSRLYYSISDDLGNSFKRPSAYSKKFTHMAVKANYLSFQEMREDEFSCRELYVDRENCCDILFLPDMYKSFYPIDIKPEVSAERGEVPSKKVPDSDFFAPPSDIGEAEKLKNKLMMYKNQIDEKDRQILKLTRLLQTRNEEIAAIDGRWRIKYRLLMDDKEAFERSRNSLLKENKKLKFKIKSLEEKYDKNQDIATTTSMTTTMNNVYRKKNQLLVINEPVKEEKTYETNKC